MCAPVFAHSRCTRIRIEKPLSVYYSYVSTVGKSGYIKKKRSSNYFREIIIQSRNFSTIRVYTRIRYIRRTIDSGSDSFKCAIRRKKKEKNMDIEVDFSLRHVEIFGHTTYLPTYL